MAKNLTNTLSEINNCLATLALQIRSANLAGHGTETKLAEYTLLPILRRIYHAPGLANANRNSANFPGVDLYDADTELGIQITAETRASKVTETIEKLVEGELPLARLVVALAVEKTPRRTARTVSKWTKLKEGKFEFDPEEDVFAFDRLLARITDLPPQKIAEISEELGALVRGSHHLQLLPYLRRQVEAQIEDEKRVARYIPEVFVETRDTKYRARCFSHPVLFLRHILCWFDREPLKSLNRLAEMSGIQQIVFPSRDWTRVGKDLGTTAHESKQRIADIEEVEQTLERYRRGSTVEDMQEVSLDESRRHVLEQTRYLIDRIAYGTAYELRDRTAELQCIAARFLLLTGPAGQGKTNLVCDFADRFLLPHDIPCAYITARQLSRDPAPDLANVVRRLIFPPSVRDLDEGLSALHTACAQEGQPFVLIIDGLNEHTDLPRFAGQLEVLLEGLAHYSFVRVLMTCRSEFLKQRFGDLLSGRLQTHFFFSEAHGFIVGEEEHAELVDRYFEFFQLEPARVHRRVIDFLRRDVLLLRFFCEAYGARGREEAYVQPSISGLYRDEIFRRYVEGKMLRAERSITGPEVQRPRVIQVISLVADHMLETGSFSDVPRSAVPDGLNEELTAILDEELLLRRDVGPRSSLMLAEPAEVLNFTFDEMRDFVLAQRLLVLHSRDSKRFKELLAGLTTSGAQVIEGLQRFLFYAARLPDNEMFFRSYRTHPWYEAVYYTEVFNVRPAYLAEDDGRRVAEAVKAGGVRALKLAEDLTVRWNDSVFPILNLNLLLDTIVHGDGSLFEEVLVPTFRGARYRRGSMGSQFFAWFEEHADSMLIRSESMSDRLESSEHWPIFRLLLELLPVDAGATLESPAVVSFRQVIARDPKLAVRVLRAGLRILGSDHRSFVWRLLAEVSGEIEDTSSLVVAAEADARDGQSPEQLRTQARWFLSHVRNYTRYL